MPVDLCGATIVQVALRLRPSTGLVIQRGNAGGSEVLEVPDFGDWLAFIATTVARARSSDIRRRAACDNHQ
jgi:hypothetical protein